MGDAETGTVTVSRQGPGSGRAEADTPTSTAHPTARASNTRVTAMAIARCMSSDTHCSCLGTRFIFALEGRPRIRNVPAAGALPGRSFDDGLISRSAVHRDQSRGNPRSSADVQAAVRQVKVVMILPVLVAAAFGLVAWTAPRSACALGDAQGVAAQDDPDVVPLDEVPQPLGGPYHLDQVAFPGATLLDADRLVAASRAYGAEHTDVFAGLFLAQGRLWLGFTADAATHLAAVRTKVDRPDLLRAFVADFPERELRALQERIAPDLTQWADAGVDVTMVGVDVRRNRVQVSLRSVGTGAAEALARHYGTAMLVFREGIDLRALPAPVPRPPGLAGDGRTERRGAGVDHGGCSASVPVLLGNPHVR